MEEKQMDRVIEDNKEAVVEMIQFWQWVRGSGKVLQWMAIFGLPIAAAIWGFREWFKNHLK